MPRVGVHQTNFASGIVGPLLEARTDLEQHKTGAAELTNVRVLPQGGVERRPGTKYIASISDAGRLAAFSFNRSDEYLLVWRDSLLEIWDDDAQITQVASPYTEAQAAEINLTQKHDTLVAFHEDVAPYRLIRVALPSAPIRTTSGSATVRVEHPSHGLADSDAVGFSGLSSVGGLSLNTDFAVTLDDGTLGANPLTTANTDETVTVDHTAHPFVTGDRVTFSGASAVNGVPQNEINRTHTVTVTGANAYTFEAQTAATGTGAGGGSAVDWVAPDLYTITAASNASSTTTGGGANGRAWPLHSLAQTRTRGVRLLDVPKFNFEDGDSPEPNDEVQRLSFGGTWADGETFRLRLGNAAVNASPGTDFSGLPASARAQREQALSEAGVSGSIAYDSGSTTVVAERIQTALREMPHTSDDGITVEHETGTDYLVTFAGSDGNIGWPEITVEVLSSAAGTLSVAEVTAGGTRHEAVISATRGWPRTGVFYQGRLWMAGLKSRPSTLLGSEVDLYFSFDTGEALDAEAVDVSGGFDPILHVVAERQMTLLTSGGEVAVRANEPTLTPTNIGFRTDSSYGASTVRPVTIGGRPMFIDRTGRSMRQVAYAFESDSFEAPEVSLLAQHLFNTPVDTAVLRDTRGDYGFVVMTDGTMGVINVNHDHGIAAWTKWETDGNYLRVVEVDDSLYALVQRTINGSSVRYLEKFDADYLTDSGKVVDAIAIAGQAMSVWTGLSHLQAATVQARGGWDTSATDTIPSNDYGDYTVSSSQITTDEEADIMEIGLGFSVEVKTLPPGLDYTSGNTINKKARLVRAYADLKDSAGVYCGGWFVQSFRNVGSEAVTNPPALLTGVYPVRLRGWSRRPQVSITQTRPQPMTLRSIELEYRAETRTT